jgi:hypothetical protein
MGEIIRHEDLRQAAALAESVHALSGKRITANLIAAEVHIGAPFKMRVKVMLFRGSDGTWSAAAKGAPMTKDDRVLKDDKGRTRYEPALAWDDDIIARRFGEACVRSVRRYDPSLFAPWEG